MPVSFQPERRSFLGQAVCCLGGAAAGAALPVSLLQASPACIAVDACGDWQLDDMCCTYPPYAFRRDADLPRRVNREEFQIDPLDVLFAV